MIMDFNDIKTAVARQFGEMSKHDLFRVGADKDRMWATYLDSFPPGTNPLFRERTEHDCSCCRHFIRTVGDVVAIVDGKLVTLWDVDVSVAGYRAVADAMAELVRSWAIENIFLHTEPAVGVDKNFENLERPDPVTLSSVRMWRHFHVDLPREVVCRGIDLGPRLSQARASFDVLHRSLVEITPESIQTVLELIAQNSLYRGEEHRHVLEAFRHLKRDFDKIRANDRAAFAWSKIGHLTESVCRIRNTAIGTLLVDLNAGHDLEDAVKSFEAKVAPANYKRPTALVTKKMVEAARAKVADLGLTSALERRYATLADISVRDILFVDRGARAVMRDAFDEVPTRAGKIKSFDKIETVPIDRFLFEVVPSVTSMEIMFDGAHAGNLVSLVAPADPAARGMFKWDNGFSWSYNGDLADSIRERVKRAGGSVTGDLCCRLAWHNYDDLDFHMVEPSARRDHAFEIYYVQRGPSPSGGRLDVDMNAGRGTTREPVENIFYGDRAKMREGVYTLYVHQFLKRESIDVGFEAEIDYLGTVHRFAHDRALRQDERVIVAKIEYTQRGGIKLLESLPSTTATKTVWGIRTNEFHRVNVLMLSPNHWGRRGVGNRHYFFMIDECRNDSTARGFFNEFLRSELDPHRRVIEIVGSRMRTEETDHQLSGLGFSSTQRAELLVRVSGSFNRTLVVTI